MFIDGSPLCQLNCFKSTDSLIVLAPDGLPYLIISDSCVGLKKNLPLLIYDENNKNDCDTDGPDDEADALRYMLIHTKWIDSGEFGTVSRPRPKVTTPKTAWLIDPKKFTE